MLHKVLDRGTHFDTGETVSIYDLIAIREAYPTHRCMSGTADAWAAAEYVERMENQVTKEQYDVVYLFSESDLEWEEGQPRQEDTYPFDEDHIARIFAVYDDER